MRTWRRRRSRSCSFHPLASALSSGTWDSREAAAEWQSVAATRRQCFAPATERMLDLATIPVGGRVLDIGAGSGDSSIAAARRVGPTGSVLATDISATMLGQA